MNIPPILRTHAMYLVLFAGAGLGASAWLREHDDRLLAQQIVKDAQSKLQESQQRVDTLQQQMSDERQLAAEERARILAASARVKTPEQAVAAMPDVSTLPVLSRPTPSSVEVAAVALYQQEAMCKADRADLQACQLISGKKDQIILEKDGQLAARDREVAALKHPGGFFKRLKDKVSDITLGAVAGEVVRLVLTGRP